MAWREAGTAHDTGLRGLPLLDAAIAHIEANPKTWNQGEWRCGSGMCIAGWAAELAGARWCAPVVCDWGDSGARCVLIAPDGRELVVSSYAQEVLGITDDNTYSLFHACNDLGRIKAIRDRLRREAAERGANHG